MEIGDVCLGIDSSIETSAELKLYRVEAVEHIPVAVSSADSSAVLLSEASPLVKP